MLAKQTLQFLAELKENNNREWFEANRDWYVRTKSDFENLVAEIIKGLSAFDKDISELLVKNCTFRQYRDVRFSKDKRPYKINMGAYFNKGGKKINSAGYYFHLEAGKSFIAGGIWMPESSPLSKIRQEIDYNFPEWKQIITKPAFKKVFPGSVNLDDSLKRAPKGYEETNPSVAYLKLKSFIVRRGIHNIELTRPGITKQIIHDFKTLKPVIDFLNRALD